MKSEVNRIEESDLKKLDKLMVGLRKRPGIVYTDDLVKIAGDEDTAVRLANLLFEEGVARQLEQWEGVALNSIDDKLRAFDPWHFRYMFKEQQKAEQEKSLSNDNLSLNNRKLRWEPYISIASLIISLVALAKSLCLF